MRENTEMYTYRCLNNISGIGLKHFDDKYQEVHESESSDAILVRSANMKDMEFDDQLKAIIERGGFIGCGSFERIGKCGSFERFGFVGRGSLECLGIFGS